MSTYQNFNHYISEGWLQQPKESFKTLAELIRQHVNEPKGQLLDIGCATGELLGYLVQQFPHLNATGIDVFDALLNAGRDRMPIATFLNASALELPPALHNRFDFVTAVGVMSIFDEVQVETFWRNLLAATKPGGLITVLSPLNEYGVDTITRHRKRNPGSAVEWETGWNVFSTISIEEILSKMGQEVSFERFVFTPVLQQREDPVRTWTLPTATNPHQLTNGLKLLVDHYFMLVKKKGPD
jgi:trans-aconitate methyltransferase